MSWRGADDLEGIIAYSLSRWGLDQTTFCLKQIRDQFEAVAVFAQTGQARAPRSGPGISSAHVIVYRIVGEQIRVIRILHKTIDFRRYF